MKNLLKIAAVAGLLLVAAGCGTTKSTTTSPTTAAGGSPTTTAGAAAAGVDANAFCTKLAAEADQTTTFAAAIGTPGQAAALDKMKAANADIVASAPAAVHDAVAKFYAVSDMADAALSASSPADRAAALKAASDAAGDPAVKAAISDYTTWVTANCGDQATKILSAGK